jgi:DNA-binding HxlR family transcriptional regulator
VHVRRDTLAKLFKKGVVDVLLFIDQRGSIRFNDVRKFCLNNHIVQSRGTVTIIIRNLTDMKLIKRKVKTTRPIQTIYETTELGREIAAHLKSIKELLGS